MEGLLKLSNSPNPKSCILWLRPMNSMMSVPFIGKLNTVFFVAIGFGMGLILLCMVFNILNAWIAGDSEHIWFDTNSVAGLVFYGSAVVSIALILTGVLFIRYWWLRRKTNPV